jgi:cytochrome c-type protein NapC
LATLHPTSLTLIAIVCAALSAGILIFYLVRRPELTQATKIALLLGLGVFPISVAATGTSKASKQRRSASSAAPAT